MQGGVGSSTRGQHVQKGSGTGRSRHVSPVLWTLGLWGMCLLRGSVIAGERQEAGTGPGTYGHTGDVQCAYVG